MSARNKELARWCGRQIAQQHQQLRDQSLGSLDRVTAHPINTYTQPVEYSIDLKDVGSLTYIQAAVNELGQFDKFADQVKGNPAWQYHLVDCGHEIMVDKPGELIELLADAASR